MMQDLINRLHSGGFSLVIANEGHIHTYTQRGVADLYELSQNDRSFLKGALVADKVIGKGAAALMIYGGVKEVYSDVISEPALQLFNDHQVKVSYKTLSPNIINRTGDDCCPLEKRCIATNDIALLLNIIESFITQMRAQTR